MFGKTLCETLNGIFHSRITYPELPEKEGERMSLLIDFIDETEEVKDEYISLIRGLVEKAAQMENIEEGAEVIGYICR